MPLLPIPSRAGSLPARALRAGLTALTALLLVTCTDNPIGPGRTGRLLVRPVFDGSALFAPLAIDNIRLIVTRPPSEVIKTITQPFPAGTDTVRVTATDIELKSTSEDLLVTIELYAGTTLLFTGTQTIKVTVGVTPQPAAIPMLYQGPGSNLAALTLTPRDTAVRPGAVFTYQVTAADSQQQSVASFYIGWKASAGTIDGTGRFTAPATRDTITITVSAPAPNTTKDSTKVFVIPGPGSLTITGGNGQSAFASTRLPALLAVRVDGTDQLPLAGVVVSFAATTGGGSVDSATATTDAQGIARSGATLGATVGAQTFTATVTGLPVVTFTETGTSTTGVHTWNGQTSPNWSVSTNWTPQTVPTNADDVIIPSGTPNGPTITTSCSARSLTVNTGATLNLGAFNCQVGGNVNATGGAITGSGAIQIATTAQVAGNLPNLQVSGAVTASGPLSLTGSLTVTGASGNLIVNGQPITVGGGFTTQSGAILTMTNAADLLTVSGNASFGGGNETGQLTAGSLTVAGNFSQSGSGSPTSFVGTGTHTVFLNGTGAQAINFGTPGFAASRFQNVIIANSAGGVTATSNLYATGTPGATPTAVRTLSGNGSTLFTAILDVNNFTFNNLLLNFAGSSPVALDTVTFQGYAPTATPLTISHPGAGGPFTFDKLTFSVTPTGAGRYLSATDADGPTPTPLTINVTNSTPASPSGLVTVANGAVVNWPSATPIQTWGGTISNDWFFSGNWVSGVAPASTDNVTIPSGRPFQPTIGSSTAVNDLTVQPGAVLSLGDISLNVTGSLDASGSIAGCCGDFIGMSGGTLKGNFSQVVVSVNLGGVVTLNGATTLSSSTVQVQGELILNGNTLNVGQGTLSTLNGAGRLTMTNPADQVIAGFTDFTGGDETGRLTAGILQTQSFSQGGTVTTSFLTGGNHKVRLAGPAPSTVTFANPANSRFQELDVSGVTATLTLGSNVTVAGQLISLPISSNGPTITGTGITLTAGGADVSAFSGFTALTMDGVPLVLSGGTIAGLSRVTFQNQNPSGTHLTVNNVGQPTPFLFGGLNFTGQLSTGGFYLVANDLDGPTANGALTINVLASTPASGAGVSNAVNGAVINWPATGNTFTWTGAVSTDWFNAGNWDRGTVPGAIDDVVLVPMTNQPVLSSNSAGVNNLTSTTGSILDLNGFVLVVNGSANVAGSINGAGSAGVALTGTGQLVRGTINADIVVVGSYLMNGSLITTGNLSVQGGLDLGGFAAQVGGSFLTINNGVLVMTNSADVLDVTGDAIFTGGSTAGLLKSGRITIGGNFSQIGTNSKQSFAADPGHLTQLSANPASIAFTDPGPTLSHFGNLAESGFGATFNLNSDVTVLGTLSGGDGFGGTMVGTSCPTVLTLTGFSTSGPLNLNCVRLVVDDPSGTTTGINGVSFVNLPTNVTQLTIRHPGLAAGSFSVFGSLTFVPLASSDTGFYLAAVDTDGTTPFLAIAPGITNVTNGPTFTTTSGGATVLWP
jgi:hypothetical protein